MLNECIEGLNINPDGLYVDVTFGGGGHSREILKHLHDGRLFAFDQDTDALSNTIEDDRFKLIDKNFRFMKNFLQLYQGLPADGILADLGISSHQIDEPSRGFSIRFEAPLDLRMNTTKPLNAADVINGYDESQLRSIFWQYGELKNASRIARTLVESRNTTPLATTTQLKQCLERLAPRGKENKFFAQIFQALRIEVNDELGALKEMLQQSIEVLKPGGRLVIMSYHSLEDRLVKNFLKSGNFEGLQEKDFYGNLIVPFKNITRKPITASAKELETNNRSRSAKLRIAEKI